MVVTVVTVGTVGMVETQETLEASEIREILEIPETREISEITDVIIGDHHMNDEITIDEIFKTVENEKGTTTIVIETDDGIGWVIDLCETYEMSVPAGDGTNDVYAMTLNCKLILMIYLYLVEAN